jgi:multiple sugar transport system permease protein
MRRRPVWLQTLRMAALAMAVLWSALPILFVVLASIRPAREIFSFPPRFLFVPTFENYAALIERWPAFFDALGNSVIIAVGATLLTVITTTLAGYVHARYRSGVLAGSAFFTIFIRMLPPIVITLPLFPVVNMLRLNDTHLILILLYATFFVSLNTWIMKAFIDQIPRELDDAAVVDGATLMQIVRHVIVPLALQGMIAASTFVLIFSWNEFLFALILTRTEAKTAPVAAADFVTLYGIQWGQLTAHATLISAPIVILGLLFQRYIVKGLTLGAVQ